LRAPLVAKLAPPVAPPNENVWLRPCCKIFTKITNFDPIFIEILFLNSTHAGNNFSGPNPVFF